MTPAKNCRPKYFRITLTTLRIPVDSRPSVSFGPTAQTKLTRRKGRRRTNGPSDQPLVTTAGAGALPIGYLPIGVLPTGHLPTGAVWTTGCGRGRSASTAVPTKANDAVPTITNFNIKPPVAARDESTRIDLYDHYGATNRRLASARSFFTDVPETARVQPDLVLAFSGRRRWLLWWACKTQTHQC